MTIRQLSEEIINQIAAGEVIENPAAIIKELIENSIDANSTQINIEIENSGLDKIIIKDNGIGISKEDLKKAPSRHATSKIKNFSDLYNINTMGFRGEALASIFSISKTTIESKTKNNYAYKISSEDITKITKTGIDNGTIITINDIFYNTPARKKYLKSERLELKHIIDIIYRFSIIHNNIKFTIKHNNKIILNKPIFKTQEQNIIYLLGKDLQDNLFELNNQNNGIKITGFIGKPSNITCSYKKNQYIFVNSRFIKSKLISQALYEGFGSNLMTARHPFFSIFIEIDPQIIDVNIHPTKIEIKFENELEIFNTIKNAVKELFQKNDSIKPFNQMQIKTKNQNYPTLNKIVSKIKSNPLLKNNKIKRKEDIKSNYTFDTQKHLNIKEEIATYEKTETVQENIITNNKTKKEEIKNNQLQKEKIIKPKQLNPLNEILKEYKIIGQINSTFIILETPIEMIMLDQHVVEEKFFYETFKKQNKKEEIKTQQLLKPHIITLTLQQILLYKEHQEIIKSLGFKTEEFGNNEIIIRAVPINLNKQEVNPEMIIEIIEEMQVNKKFKKLEEQNLDKLASIACKKSLKAGAELTSPQIHKMIENLKTLDEPFNCPHGRPIMLRYTFKELEKKFKRIL